MSSWSLDPAGSEEEGDIDAEDVAYKQELLQLLQQESEGNDVFLYCKSTFKDEYGDQHDWQSDTTVQHYLCRQLYLHYTQQVCQLPSTVLSYPHLCMCTGVREIVAGMGRLPQTYKECEGQAIP